MRNVRLALFASLVFAGTSNPLNAQDPVVGFKSAQQPQLDSEVSGPAIQNNKAMVQHVEQLTNRAAALRTEGSFKEAAEIDNEIRKTCFENDPRLIRANELKRRASESLLEGRILDADMYNREAERILKELMNEFSRREGNRDEPRMRSGTDQPSKNGNSEIDLLKRQLQQLAAELQAVKNRIGLPAVWNPNASVTIAIAGAIDIDGDGTDDLEELKRLITSSGGVIVAFQTPDGSVHGQIDATTRYLVVGKSSPTELASNQLVLDANRNSVEQIGLAKLLQRIGVRSNAEPTKGKEFQSRK